MPKKFWQFRNQAAGSAELLLYGDISDSSWWGDEVTPKTFADELNALGALTSLTVRINSGGGDVFAAQTIGNLLEQHTAQVTARIDGLCASAATIIACHCDKVVAANDSTYMIHPVRMGIFDFADAVTLQQYICIAVEAETPHTAWRDHWMKHCQQEMTVIQNAWPVVCNFGWLIEADRNARKGKRYRAEVLNFTARLEDNLFTIQQGMMNGSYVLGPYRKLWVYVPKKRLVMALDYPDRIVQWSLYLYLNPIYDRLFIEDSYACRKGKGSHKAAKRLQYWMCQVQRKPGPGWYCLKLDISKYFYRVNHEKLLAILGRRVKDPAMMAFIRGVVNSRAEPFGLPRWRTPQDTPPEEWMYEVGMPIGNLTSQLFANIYLNELDQYCKHRLKIHYYIRYMDDVIILGQDKETLHRWKAAVETFLREELALDLNSKTSIRPVRQGVEFVGVRIWPTHMKLRKSTVRRIKREVRKISALYAAGDMTRQDFYRRIASIRGLLKHTESASLRWRLNEIYRAELEKAKQKQLREEAQHEPFADHSGAGNGDGNAGTGYQDHGNPACRAG